MIADAKHSCTKGKSIRTSDQNQLFRALYHSYYDMVLQQQILPQMLDYSLSRPDCLDEEVSLATFV